MKLRLGTRGSDLALTQARWFCDRLRSAHPGLEIEEIIIKTHGDRVQDRPFDASWPVGSFVSELENALVEDKVDFAVHSFKDLPTQSPEPLVIAAVPGREEVADVLITAKPCTLDDIGPGFTIGTSSPRRQAQWKRFGDVELVPIRGNVPTRMRKVEEGLDGVILAAAGLKRLGLQPAHAITLPVDQFVPSPAQGALAVQTRRDTKAEAAIGVLNEDTARRGVDAERQFLTTIGAGCHTPVGALACVEGETITLFGQLFTDDMTRVAEGEEVGADPFAVGAALAQRLVAELGT
ncbi:MAG: hydroxymethylbilane synthase [Phycisphaerales bacterium JB038]